MMYYYLDYKISVFTNSLDPVEITFLLTWAKEGLSHSPFPLIHQAELLLKQMLSLLTQVEPGSQCSSSGSLYSSLLLTSTSTYTFVSTYWLL